MCIFFQKYEFDESEKIRKMEEAKRLVAEAKRKEEEARKKEEDARRKAELRLIKPVPTRKPKEPKNKENVSHFMGNAWSRTVKTSRKSDHAENFPRALWDKTN